MSTLIQLVFGKKSVRTTERMSYLSSVSGEVTQEKLVSAVSQMTPSCVARALLGQGTLLVQLHGAEQASGACRSFLFVSVVHERHIQLSSILFVGGDKAREA